MILPLGTNPEETFNYSFNGVIYTFIQKWNTLGFWTLDILDVDGNPYVYGVKIVTKEYLLSQYPSIPFNLKSERDNDPSRTNINQFNLEITEK